MDIVTGTYVTDTPPPTDAALAGEMVPDRSPNDTDSTHRVAPPTTVTLSVHWVPLPLTLVTTPTLGTDLVSRKSLADTPTTSVLNTAVKFTTSPVKDDPEAPPLEVSVTVGGAYVTVSAPPADAALGGETLPDPSTKPTVSVAGCRDPSTVTTST
jgi:hypothetical protein